MVKCDDCKTKKGCFLYGCTKDVTSLWKLMLEARRPEMEALSKKYPNDADLGKAFRVKLLAGNI